MEVIITIISVLLLTGSLASSFLTGLLFRIAIEDGDTNIIHIPILIIFTIIVFIIGILVLTR